MLSTISRVLPRQLLGAPIQRGTSTVTVDEPVVDEPAFGGGGWLIADRQVARLAVDGVGVFAVEGGRRIGVDLERDADPLMVEAWLYGTFAALVLGQQGRFALHATTVEVDGTGVAVAGHSGAGKSTTALELCRRGHRLIADDVSPLDMGKNGSATEAVVQPFGRPVHLWPETADALGVELSTGAAGHALGQAGPAPASGIGAGRFGCHIRLGL